MTKLTSAAKSGTHCRRTSIEVKERWAKHSMCGCDDGAYSERQAKDPTAVHSASDRAEIQNTSFFLAGNSAMVCLSIAGQIGLPFDRRPNGFAFRSQAKWVCLSIAGQMGVPRLSLATSIYPREFPQFPWLVLPYAEFPQFPSLVFPYGALLGGLRLPQLLAALGLLSVTHSEWQGCC